MTMMQLAVPDLKRGRVGSALNAMTTAAGLDLDGYGRGHGRRYLVCE